MSSARSLHRSWLLLAALLCTAAPAVAQGRPEFAVRAGSAVEGWRSLVEARGILRDAALRRALESGLPLRLRLRVELWEKRLFDRLVSSGEAFLVLVQDPLDDAYVLDSGTGERRFASLARAGEAVDAALRVDLRPDGGGRFYYLATLEIETLSLSDLEELRRWLRGEVRPAVAGRAPPERALETGLRRVLVRVIGLPTRRYEGRSATFTPR